MHASERHSARLTSVREWTWSSIATLPSLSPHPALHPCCPENFYSRCLSLMHVKRGTHKRSFIVPQRAPARATRLRQVLISGTRSRAGCRALVAVVAQHPPNPTSSLLPLDVCLLSLPYPWLSPPSVLEHHQKDVYVTSERVMIIAMIIACG